MPEIFEALWPLKNILSDVIVDVSYITHKCTTFCMFTKGLLAKKLRKTSKIQWTPICVCLREYAGHET